MPGLSRGVQLNALQGSGLAPEGGDAPDVDRDVGVLLFAERQVRAEGVAERHDGLRFDKVFRVAQRQKGKALCVEVPNGLQQGDVGFLVLAGHGRLHDALIGLARIEYQFKLVFVGPLDDVLIGDEQAARRDAEGGSFRLVGLHKGGGFFAPANGVRRGVRLARRARQGRQQTDQRPQTHRKPPHTPLQSPQAE